MFGYAQRACSNRNSPAKRSYVHHSDQDQGNKENFYTRLARLRGTSCAIVRIQRARPVENGTVLVSYKPR